MLNWVLYFAMPFFYALKHMEHRISLKQKRRLKNQKGLFTFRQYFKTSCQLNKFHENYIPSFTV